ncbi:MAG: RNA methyltransferase [Desulfosarcina sp.]
MNDSPSLKPKNEPVGDSTFDKRVRRQVTGRVRTYYAIVAPGVEDLCRQELIDLGIDAGGISVEAGGVTFAGRLVDCQLANLHLRTATRILMRIETFSATNERQLEKKAIGVPWELFLSAGSLPDIKVRSRRSRLHHTEAIGRIIHRAVTHRLEGLSMGSRQVMPQSLFVRVVQDRFTLSLDSSGAPLYQRGLKIGPARAPLRETLAAAILMTAAYDPKQPLVDPLCGSGTFALEAAMMAKRIAPGINRDFVFMGWPAFGEGQWAFLKRQAESRNRACNRPLIFASDLDADACRRLVATIKVNGLTDIVRVAQKDLFACEGSQYGSGPGLVTINPPYGIRLGSAKQADDLFTAICGHLSRRFRGWRVALVVPRRQLLRRLTFPARQLPLFHGGLRLTLVVGTIK